MKPIISKLKKGYYPTPPVTGRIKYKECLVHRGLNKGMFSSWRIKNRESILNTGLNIGVYLMGE